MRSLLSVIAALVTLQVALSAPSGYSEAEAQDNLVNKLLAAMEQTKVAREQRRESYVTYVYNVPAEVEDDYSTYDQQYYNGDIIPFDRAMMDDEENLVRDFVRAMSDEDENLAEAEKWNKKLKKGWKKAKNLGERGYNAARKLPYEEIFRRIDKSGIAKPFAVKDDYSSYAAVQDYDGDDRVFAMGDEETIVQDFMRAMRDEEENLAEAEKHHSWLKKAKKIGKKVKKIGKKGLSVGRKLYNTYNSLAGAPARQK